MCLRMKYNRTPLQWLLNLQNHNIDFWFDHLQLEFEAPIWWFRRVHQYSSITKYEGLTPTRNGFIDESIFRFTMGFSYNGMLLCFHSRISLEIQPNITNIEKYFVLRFSIMHPTPQDLYDHKIRAPNSVWKFPNDTAKHV